MRVLCVVIVSLSFAACASSTSAPTSAGSARASIGSQLRPTVPVTAAVAINRACTLLTTSEVASALGKPSGQAVANGSSTVAGVSGRVGLTSQCLFNALDGSYTVTVDDEAYEQLSDATTRFDQTDHSDFDQLPLDDGGFLQQPAVLLGVRNGPEIAFVSVGPRPTDQQLTALGRGLSQGLTAPAPTSVASPGADGPDPCAYQQSVPLPDGYPLSRVTRIEPDFPFVWACAYQYENTGFGFTVEATTTDRLGDAGVASPDALLEMIAGDTAIDPPDKATVQVIDSDGNLYPDVASVPSGTPAFAAVGGTDTMAAWFPSPNDTAANAQKNWIIYAKLDQLKDCLEEIEFIHKAQRMTLNAPVGPFSDPFLALTVNLDDEKGLQDECRALKYQIDRGG